MAGQRDDATGSAVRGAAMPRGRSPCVPVPTIPAVSPAAIPSSEPAAHGSRDEARVARRDDRVEERGRPRQLVARGDDDGVRRQHGAVGHLHDERRLAIGPSRTRAARARTCSSAPGEAAAASASNEPRYRPEQVPRREVVGRAARERAEVVRVVRQPAHRDRGHVEPVPRIRRPERHAPAELRARLEHGHGQPCRRRAAAGGPRRACPPPRRRRRPRAAGSCGPIPARSRRTDRAGSHRRAR